MKCLILFLVLIVVVVPTTYGKTFNKCELAVELVRLGITRSTLPDWICLIQAESKMKTHNLGTINKNKTRDYGLFQINNGYWCKMGSAGKDCNVSCESLLDDNITDDVACAKKVFKRHGFRAWYGWRTHCQGALPTVTECF